MTPAELKQQVKWRGQIHPVALAGLGSSDLLWKSRILSHGDFDLPAHMLSTGATLGPGISQEKNSLENLVWLAGTLASHTMTDVTRQH